MTNETEYLTVDEVVRMLSTPTYPGPSRPTIWRWIQRGTMPKPLNIPGGRRLLFRKTDIEEWLRTR